MNSDRLYYFSNSAAKAPGKGVNEYVSDPNKYTRLAQISDWRRKLSNFYVALFVVLGVEWNTVEHMFQSYKINIADSGLAWSFCINSGSQLSMSDGSIAQKNRKAVVLSPEQLRQWETLKDTILYTALKAKFTQNAELRELLLATGNAELWHGAPRTTASRQFLLERVRSEL